MRALIDQLPDEDLVYFGDTGRFPYGPKPHDEVLKYALDIADVLLARDVKMIVVVCNSAAAAALDALRERLDDPGDRGDRAGHAGGDGSHPGGRVGVIGTVGTVASGAYQRCAPRSHR